MSEKLTQDYVLEVDSTPADEMRIHDVISQLLATDNDMSYWWDQHKTTPEDVVHRLLHYMNQQANIKQAWRKATKAAYDEDPGLRCWAEAHRGVQRDLDASREWDNRND